LLALRALRRAFCFGGPDLWTKGQPQKPLTAKDAKVRKGREEERADALRDKIRIPL
jgi:hypothetical protein